MSDHGITIQDVARTCGVSSTTISNFLNGRHDEMRSETAERIRQVIEELDYTPNSAARQLKTGQSPILGLLVPTVVNPYFAELAVAVDLAAQKKGYRIILCNTQRQPKHEIELIRELLASGVKGILSTSIPQNIRTTKALIGQGVAFVIFEAPINMIDIGHIDVVSMDNALATSKAVEYLSALGHRSIAYVTATPLTPHRQLRMESYIKSMQKPHLDMPYVLKDEDIAARFSSHNDRDLTLFGREAARHILKKTPLPSAVITLNDQIALGMMFSFIEQGVKIPDDISIVGIDDTQICGFVHPGLTSIRQPYQQIAETAIEKVSKRLATPECPASSIFFEPSLVCRTSASTFHSMKKRFST